MAVIRGYPIQLPDTPVIYRGDPFTWKLQLGDPAVSLVPFGTPWASQLRVSTGSTTAINFAIDTGHLAAGYIVLSLTGTVTAGLARNSYNFDVQSGTVTVWSGSVSVAGEYTRG